MRTVLILLAWLPLVGPLGAQTVDFAKDVKPILARHCTSCHGSAKQRAGLRLDSGVGVLRGSDSGPILVSGKGAESKIILALRGKSDVPAMPPKGPPLDDREFALVKKWIDQGAKAPAGEIEAAIEKNKHWAFVVPMRPTFPAVKNENWTKTPLDRFILARLESRGLKPLPEADRVTLLRRLSLDLIGLPPTPDEVDAFLADQQPGAYERQVDRLLQSPHHGERWARHWLDAARYADSNGYNSDAARSIWKYRDWVIQAFNTDLPFDQFVVDQLAGDLLPNATLDQKIATGFHRNSMFNDEGGTDPEQSRDEGLVDRVNTTGTVFLGLTIGCAQCHDHKYDPVTQKDYYQLYAFFNGSEDVMVECADSTLIAQRDALRQRIKALQVEKDGRFAFQTYLMLFHDQGTAVESRKKMRGILSLPVRKQTAEQKHFLDQCVGARDAGYRQVAEGIALLGKQEPKFTTTLGMKVAAKARETFIHVRGDFLRKGTRVEPNVPSALPTLAAISGARPNRLDLARWLVHSANPLTARVMMNRLWQQYFGLGLVETENDFGLQGTPPTHPELLDYLAVEFRDQKWSLKAMHRQVVLSAVYRQSSRYRPDLAAVDPRNRLLGRQNRLRLEAEILRDEALAVSGLLTRTIGGPSVFPPQPGGLDAYARSPKGWKADTGPNRYRRGMYTHFWRSIPHPTLTVFDSGDATTACTRRSRSTTPLQALTLANDQAFVECARALAERVLREEVASDSLRLRFLFRLCLAREPAADEAAALTEALVAQRASAELAAAAPGNREKAAWTVLTRALLNLDEFITRE